MELRHLRYFLAVAEARHFGRAAARLHIAQPPLSVQIRDLEEELGAPLFHRGPRGVTLTDAGVAFLPQAEAVLAAARQATAVARDAAAGRHGRLVLGFIPTLAYTLLPHLLPAYRQAHPRVAVSLREVPVAEKEDALLAGHVDVALYRPPPRHPEIEVAAIGAERMILALPPGHRLARRRQVPAAALADETLVMYTPSLGDRGLYGTVAAWLRAQGLQPRSAEIAGTIPTALGMVLSGAGLAIVPESSASLRLPGLVFRPFAEPQARVALAVCWRHGDPSALAASFVAHARSMQHPWAAVPLS
ncbi:LysR family transcriptional regulator [Pseudorhodoferax sp.]|uniref:LysR family transcriptional regulator n=1 Tax=Pseudorhodoferax sp. TaxID=1993553 RepID=UPI002DD65760|nr:LysR substrate-binding domain-containing protein [Pseudorhodoferax sp.]